MLAKYSRGLWTCALLALGSIAWATGGELLLEPLHVSNPRATLSTELGRGAKTQAQAWHNEGQLPFPDFDEGVSAESDDVLDYPLVGSPHYQPSGSNSRTAETEARRRARDALRIGFAAKRSDT